MLTKEDKQRILENEFAELRRVGQTVFGNYSTQERDRYIHFDLSVLRTKRPNSQLEPYK